MGIMEAFFQMLRNIKMKWGYHKKLLRKKLACTEHI